MISMYGPMMYGSMGMTGAMYSANVPQYFQQRYGCGHEDFGTRPYVQPYPMAINPIPKPSQYEEIWLCRFIKRYFT